MPFHTSLHSKAGPCPAVNSHPTWQTFTNAPVYEPWRVSKLTTNTDHVYANQYKSVYFHDMNNIQENESENSSVG